MGELRRIADPFRWDTVTEEHLLLVSCKTQSHYLRLRRNGEPVFTAHRYTCSELALLSYARIYKTPDRVFEEPQCALLAAVLMGKLVGREPSRDGVVVGFSPGGQSFQVKVIGTAIGLRALSLYFRKLDR
jgi:hypothetical protein